MRENTLILFRGLPGSGKSTASELLVDHSISADEFFDTFYGGVFHPHLLPTAHKWCQDCAKGWMDSGIKKIGVHNTFTRVREMRPYFELADKYQYRVITLVVENRHGNKSIHGVPEETMERMENRFSIKLNGEESWNTSMK